MEVVAGTTETDQTPSSTTAVRVALLDNERIFRDSLTVLLGSFGIEVACATGDARDLLELLHRHQVSVAIMGLPLGDSRDGASLLRAITEHAPQLRTVVVSTSADPLFATALFSASDAEARVTIAMRTALSRPARAMSSVRCWTVW